MYLVSIFEADSGQAQVQPPMLQTPTAFNSLVRPAEVKFHDDPVVIAKGPLVPIQNYQTLNPAPAGPREIHALPLPALAESLEKCSSFVPAPNYIQHQVQPLIDPTWAYQYQSGPVQPNPGGFHQATMEQHQVPATQFYPIMANQVPMGWSSPDISHHMEPTPTNLMWHNSLSQAQYDFRDMETSRNLCASPGSIAMSSFGGSMSSSSTAYPNYSTCSSQQFSGLMSHSSSSSWGPPHSKLKSKGQKQLTKPKQKMWEKKLNYCKLCKSNKEMRATFESHVAVDKNGITRCPVLRALVCPLCGASGDFGHTMKYCPKVLEKKEIETDEQQEKEEVDSEQDEPLEKLPVIMEEFQNKEDPQDITSKTNLDEIRSTAGGYFLAKY